MPLWHFNCLEIVFRVIAFVEDRPAQKNSSLDCLEPGGFDGVAVHVMHPLDCLFYGWEVVNAIGFSQLFLDFLVGMCGVMDGSELPIVTSQPSPVQMTRPPHQNKSS